MGSAPGQGAQLHDADEAGQVEHLPLEVVAVAHAAQVEQLGPCTRRALRWWPHHSDGATVLDCCQMRAHCAI